MYELQVGMAKCTDAEAIPELEEGKLYFIQEIPNMPGHVVVLGHLCAPLVGVHIERFKMYDPETD